MANKYYLFFSFFLSTTLLGGDFNTKYGNEEHDEAMILSAELTQKIREFSGDEKISTHDKVMIIINHMYSSNNSIASVCRNILVNTLYSVLSELALIETNIAVQKLGKRCKNSFLVDSLTPLTIQGTVNYAKGFIRDSLYKVSEEKRKKDPYDGSPFLQLLNTPISIFDYSLARESREKITIELTEYLHKYLCEKNYFKNSAKDFIFFNDEASAIVNIEQLEKNFRIRHLFHVCTAKLEKMVMIQLINDIDLFQIQQNFSYNEHAYVELRKCMNFINNFINWRDYRDENLKKYPKKFVQPWLSSLDDLFQFPYIIFLLGNNDKTHELNTLNKDLVKHIITLAIYSK